VSARQILLDEHVGRVFERLQRERGYDVVQAKDQFGEYTTDAEMVGWCAEFEAVLITNNTRHFEPLHHTAHHAGILLYHHQSLPDTDPEGLARTVDEVFNQYGTDGIENQLVGLGEWYGWLPE
jgi:hypothetical protein